MTSMEFIMSNVFALMASEVAPTKKAKPIAISIVLGMPASNVVATIESAFMKQEL